MSSSFEDHFDEYDYYNFDHDKHIYTGHGGKQRSKREAGMHTNQFDPNGHSRKIVTKLMNSEHNKRVIKSK
ncbi:nuclear protein 1 [Copidosoma floridanum]|uniref:nuclear protein 1 n=1 Tax=Copidosoma floridanum TaxID=29053 RepID=UPI0006C95095|nr:nuclear protein 1 [Copidosoma floridanum]